MYELLKLGHLICVALSGSFFLFRGVVMLRSPEFVERKTVRRWAESVDTVLLFTGIGLIWMADQMPWKVDWLGVKLLLLLLYILLGMLAFHWLDRMKAKSVAWVTAVMTFTLMLAIAWTRNPWPFSG